MLGRRDERKLITRQALLDAALALSRTTGSVSGVSLREVARAAGVVPTAFYRHFRDMDELGLALVEDACLGLRRIIRGVRTSASAGRDTVVRTSVEVFVRYVLAYDQTFELLTRERFGASPALRQAIAREIRYFIGELADDLRALERFARLPSEDVEMIADLVVHTVLNLTADLLELPEQQRLEGADSSTGPTMRRRELTERTVKQLRLIFLGADRWRPGGGARAEIGSDGHGMSR